MTISTKSIILKTFAKSALCAFLLLTVLTVAYVASSPDMALSDLYTKGLLIRFFSFWLIMTPQFMTFFLPRALHSLKDSHEKPPEDEKSESITA